MNYYEIAFQLSCILGVYNARIHEDEIWWKENSDLSGYLVIVCVHLHQDFSKWFYHL